MGIRLVVVDDNPHVAWDGADLLGNATFQQFVAAAARPARLAGRVDHVVRAGPRRRSRRRRPCRSTRGSGSSATAPFDGIAGYLRHLPGHAAGQPADAAAARSPSADLVWLKVPASNAALAGAIAARAGMPRFVWVAGSAADVAAGRFDGIARRRWPGAIGTRLRRWSGGWSVSAAGGSWSARGWSTATGSSPAWSSRPSCATRRRGPGRRAIPTADPPRLGRPAGGRQGPRGAARGGRRSIRRLELDVLGDGPDRARLRELAGASGAGDRVTVGRPRRRPGDVPGPPGRRRCRSSSRRPPRAFPRSSSMRSRSGCPWSRRGRGRWTSWPTRASSSRSRPEPDAAAIAAWRRRVARREPASVVDAAAPASARLRGPPHATGRGRATRRALAIDGGRTCHGTAERVGSAGARRDRLLDVDRRARLGLRRLPRGGGAPRPAPTRSSRTPRTSHRP